MLWTIDQPDLIFFQGWTNFHNVYFLRTKIRNSNFGHGSGRILSFASYHYLLATAAAAEFWIILATTNYLIPKSKNQDLAAAAAEFWILLAIAIYLDKAL